MSIRQSYPRRKCRDGGFWENLLDTLQSDCRHFRNYHFRQAVTERLVNSGTLEAILKRCYDTPDGREVEFGGRGGTLATLAHRAARPTGAACAGRRVPSMEIRSDGVLDAAVALQDGSPVLPQCNKVAIVFAAHPHQSGNDIRGITFEEEELLGRSTFGEVYFKVVSEPDEPPALEVSELCGGKYISAGAMECLVAENVWLLRHADIAGRPDAWRTEPRNFGAAVCFLPQHPSVVASMEEGPIPPTSDRRCVYADKKERVQYHAQVDAAMQLCCLLDCDGLVIGCAEGICGSEVFGQPLGEVAQVWRDALELRASQFRRVAFALGKSNPMTLRATASLLGDVIGATAP